MTGMTDPTLRKKNTGEPTSNGGHFGSKTNTDSAVTLDAEPSKVTTEKDLRRELAILRAEYEGEVGSLNFEDSDFGAQVNTISERYLESFTGVAHRVDGLDSKTVNAAFDEELGAHTTDRVATFMTTWRPVETSHGWVLKQGVTDDDDGRTFKTKEGAAEIAAHENGRVARARAFSRASRDDDRWDSELYPDDEALLDAYAAEFPGKAQNVSEVNTPFGLVRLSMMDGVNDEIILEDAKRPQFVRDMLISDPGLTLRIKPELLAAHPSLDDLSRTVGNSYTHFGHLIGAKFDTEGKPEATRFKGAAGGTDHVSYKVV